MREVTLERNTNETQIELTLNLDGAGRYEVDTGCGFLNHMLELFARHGRFTTTRLRISALHWGRPLPGRWARCGASSGMAASTCPWMRRWCSAR